MVPPSNCSSLSQFYVKVPLKLFSDPVKTTSLDSTSLIQGGPGGGGDNSRTTGGGGSGKGWWWRHPRVRQNWKMVMAAAFLVLLGFGLILTGTIAYLLPSLEGVQAGCISFLSGFLLESSNKIVNILTDLKHVSLHHQSSSMDLSVFVTVLLIRIQIVSVFGTFFLDPDPSSEYGKVLD